MARDSAQWTGSRSEAERVQSSEPVHIVEAREIIDGFHAMIRRKAEADLNPWIERARASLVASFANGVARDIAAVRAAIVTSWSNGQTEGQITKLKLRSEEHTSELQSLMRISYAVFCLKKKNKQHRTTL